MEGRSKWIYGGVAVCLVAAGVGFWKKDELTSWYNAGQLAKAEPDQRQKYFATLFSSGSSGFKSVLSLFIRNEAELCQATGIELEKFLKVKAQNPAALESLFSFVTSRWTEYSQAGQEAVAECLSNVLESLPQRSRTLRVMAATFVENTSHSPPEGAGLFRMMRLIIEEGGEPAEQVGRASRTLLQKGLSSKQETTRIAAARLAGLYGDSFSDVVTPMVLGKTKEPSAEVRTIVLLALSNDKEHLPTEELARFLHDSSPEVRKICESILKTRSLKTEQIEVFRCLYDPLPQTRAKVPFMVLQQNMDSQRWLTHLAKDSSPTVRAAVIKALGYLGENHHRNFLGDLVEAETDPTVKQIGSFYLQQWEKGTIRQAGYQE